MRDKTGILRWCLGGFIWGVVIAFGSGFVAGAGHGWVSALPFGLLALLTTPLVTIAWARRRTTGGKKLAVITLGIGIIADALLFKATLIEGTEYFYKVFSMAILWILMWSSWQVPAIIILISGKSVNRA